MENVVEYYKLSPENICEDVNETQKEITEAEIEGIKLKIFPHVYPSQKFRTTSFLLRNLKDIVKGKKICDMGCGPGIVGLYSLKHGAKYVLQADINSNAVQNASDNNVLNGYPSSLIFSLISDCFDNFPKEVFDVIIFNMPFHCDSIEIKDPLQFAFYDPAFVSIGKFLKQATEYSHEKTEIFIAFSNKGNVKLLEKLFDESSFNWELWKLTNTDQEFDNRIYKLIIKNL